MSQKYNSRRNSTDGTPDKILLDIEWEKKNILIVAKTYPSISQKYDETVCIAGITSECEWIRLYPLKYRYLPRSKKFRTFQWINVEVTRNQKDRKRKESYRVREDSINLGKRVDTENNWKERKALLLPHVSSSLEEILEKYHKDGTSLGMFKPKDIDFKVEAADDSWRPNQQAKQDQLKLIGKQPKRLEKIPFKFSYEFTCADRFCKSHKLSIHDWQIMQLYRNVRDNYDYAQDEILGKIKQKYLDEMWGDTKDSYLIVGSVYPKKTFIVISVFYPPK